VKPAVSRALKTKKRRREEGKPKGSARRPNETVKDAKNVVTIKVSDVSRGGVI